MKSNPTHGLKMRPPPKKKPLYTNFAVGWDSGKENWRKKQIRGALGIELPSTKEIRGRQSQQQPATQYTNPPPAV